MFTFTRQSYIRSGYVRQDVPETAPAGTEVYFFGDNILLTFTGKANKPAIYANCGNPTHRSDVLLQWLTNITTHEAEKAARRTARKEAVCPFQVGQILQGSWGYDQTNQELWEVVEVKGRKLTLRECAHIAVPGTHGFDCCEVMPQPNPNGKIITKIAQTYDGQSWYVRMASYCTLHVFSGKAVYKSWYH